MVSSIVYENAVIRAAMLDAQSEWLEEASRESASPAERVIAAAIAAAFDVQSQKYKTQPTKEMNDAGPLWIDDERGEAQGVPSSG